MLYVSMLLPPTTGALQNYSIRESGLFCSANNGRNQYNSCYTLDSNPNVFFFFSLRHFNICIRCSVHRDLESVLLFVKLELNTECAVEIHFYCIQKLAFKTMEINNCLKSIQIAMKFNEKVKNPFGSPLISINRLKTLFHYTLP